RPDAGLLEPADVEVADPVAELDGLRAGVALVRVDRQDEVGTGGFARRLEPEGVFPRLFRSDLELAPAKAQLAPLRDLVADPVEVASVVAADDVDADRVAVA